MALKISANTKRWMDEAFGVAMAKENVSHAIVAIQEMTIGPAAGDAVRVNFRGSFFLTAEQYEGFGSREAVHARLQSLAFPLQGNLASDHADILQERLNAAQVELARYRKKFGVF